MTPGISRALDLPHYPVGQIQWFPRLGSTA
jgi:hypothetical protein